MTLPHVAPENPKRWRKAVTLGLSTILTSAGCAAPPPSPLTKMEDGRWYFRGMIDETTADLVRNALSAEPANMPLTLEVDSPGGDALSGMALGSYLHDRHVTIEVHRLCASACAQYLFLGAPNRVVAPHGVVLFHGSPTLLFNSYQASGLLKAAALFKRGRDAEQTYYRHVGVQLPFSRLATEGWSPLCLAIDPSKSSNDPYRYNLKTRSVTYGISRRTLAAANMIVSGYWPENAFQMMQDIASLHMRNGFSASFVDDITPAGRDNGNEQHALDQCDPS